jgi:hypothetical protein
MARPYRITLSVVVDREALVQSAAEEQGREVRREIARAVGGAIQAIDVVSIEPTERRQGGERRSGDSIQAVSP